MSFSIIFEGEGNRCIVTDFEVNLLSHMQWKYFQNLWSHTKHVLMLLVLAGVPSYRHHELHVRSRWYSLHGIPLLTEQGIFQQTHPPPVQTLPEVTSSRGRSVEIVDPCLCSCSWKDGVEIYDRTFKRLLYMHLYSHIFTYQCMCSYRWMGKQRRN